MVLKLFVLLFLTCGPKSSYETFPKDNFPSNFDKQTEDVLAPLERLKNFTVQFPRDCKEIQNRGVNISGVYLIQSKLAAKPFGVFCDMETRGGGWTYLLNRCDGSQSFYLDWQNYKNGFGSLLGEFWLGLDNIHYLTASEDNELLIELVDWNQNEVYALYKSFRVGNEGEGYVLSVSNYSGTAGDPFSYLSGTKFSTRDRDQDTFYANCALRQRAAWWYGDCAAGQLTGEYLKNIRFSCCRGIFWRNSLSLGYSLEKAKMMVRPLRQYLDVKKN